MKYVLRVIGTVFDFNPCMKKITLLFFIFIGLSAHSTDAQKTLRKIDNNAFRPGELLKFRIHYGFIDAGTASLEVKPDLKNIGGRECYHVLGLGQTVGAFDWFFKVRDRYESVIDKHAMIPWLFFRRVNEGGYIINQNVSFNHFRDSATSEKKTISIVENTQDLLSAFYYARTIDFSKANVGDVFPITGYLDDELINLNFKFAGRESIKTKIGTVRCVKFIPLLTQGRVFKESEDMIVWVSDDLNRIPVRVQANILVGSLKMDITDYENILHPIAFEKKR